MIGWPNLVGRIAELEAQVRVLKAERDALLLKIAMLESDRDQEAWRLP